MNFLELEERAHNGELLDKDSWDMERVVLAVADIVEKYGLDWDRQNICPNDDELCRKIYQAGRELLLESGVYNSSTGRIIRFTEEEIDRAAANQPKKLAMGRGSDIRHLYARGPESPLKPVTFGGNPGCPTPERLFKATVTSWAQEPEIDMLTCGSLVDIDGYEVRRGEISEVLAVRRELTYLNQASRDVGRAGMGRLAAESAVSEIGDLAAFAEGFIQPGDAHLVALNNELITNTDNMIRAAGAMQTGVLNASLAWVMVGGLAGDAPGSAVTMVASMLATNI